MKARCIKNVKRKNPIKFYILLILAFFVLPKERMILIMKDSVYKKAKLAIFEKTAAGEYNEDQRANLLAMLEAKKDEESLTSDQIEDFLDQLSGMYPDLKDDIKKLAKKIENAGGDSDDSGDDESDGDVSESADDENFYSWLNTL